MRLYKQLTNNTFEGGIGRLIGKLNSLQPIVENKSITFHSAGDYSYGYAEKSGYVLSEAYWHGGTYGHNYKLMGISKDVIDVNVDTYIIWVSGNFSGARILELIWLKRF